MSQVFTIKPDPGSAGKQITVQLADQYGVQVVRPVCEDAKRFAAIAGTKTLTDRAIEQIKALGYTIHELPPQRTL